MKLEFDSKNAMLEAAVRTFCGEEPLIPGAANVPEGRPIDLELTYPGADMGLRVAAVSRGLDPAGAGLRLDLMEPDKLRRAVMLMIELHFGAYVGSQLLEKIGLNASLPAAGSHEVISSLVEEELAATMRSIPDAKPRPDDLDLPAAEPAEPTLGRPPRLRPPALKPLAEPSSTRSGPPRLRPPLAPSPKHLAQRLASRLPSTLDGKVAPDRTAPPKINPPTGLPQPAPAPASSPPRFSLNRNVERTAPPSRPGWTAPPDTIAPRASEARMPLRERPRPNAVAADSQVPTEVQRLPGEPPRLRPPVRPAAEAEQATLAEPPRLRPPRMPIRRRSPGRERDSAEDGATASGALIPGLVATLDPPDDY